MTDLLKPIPFKSVPELHEAILSKVTEYKAGNPFAPVTIVTSSPLEGFLLRRQLIEANAKSGISAMANLSILTPNELVNELWNSLGNEPVRRPSSSVIEATIFALLQQDQKDKESLQSMATANAIAKVFKKLEFVSDDSIQRMHDSKLATSTQTRVLDLVLKARRFHKSFAPFEMVEKIIQEVKQATPALAKMGQIHFLSQGAPLSLLNLLGQIQSASAQVYLYEAQGTQDGKIVDHDGLSLVSAPDPMTECSIVVRSAVQKLNTIHADRIAILYSDESQYLNQIQDELDSAGIAWNGRTRTMAQSSVLYRTLEILIEALTERNASTSGFDRPKLMRLIQNGNLVIDKIAVEADQVRKFVRKSELYADTLGWLNVLNLLDSEAENEKDSLAREHLTVVVKAVATGLGHVASSTTWTEYGSRLMKLVRDLHQEFDLEESSPEDKAWQEIQKLLQHELVALDELNAEHPEIAIQIDPKNLLRLVRKRIGDKRLRRGSLGTGIFVGSISEAQFLNFDIRYVLGATEGLLPPAVNSDPFLPSVLLAEVGESDLANWSKENQPSNLGRVLSSITAAGNVVLLRPRGGMAAKFEDEPSRYLPNALNENANFDAKRLILVNSFVSSFGVSHGGNTLLPVSIRDISAIQAHLTPKPDPVFSSSLAAWRNPQFDAYFGNLSDLAKKNPIWEPNHSLPLSSTRIDAYLQCPYKFFVETVLGFRDNDRSDVLDSFSATAFGIFFHQAMDSYIKYLAKENKLPGEGESFSPDASQVFLKQFLTPNLNRFLATGKNGWNRSLQIHIAKLVKRLPHFFATEVQELRSNPGLRIQASEESFGKNVLLPESESTPDKPTWDVQVKDLEGVPHRIVGQVDRLDVSADGKTVGIMDFKTGSRKNFIKKLGMHTKKQSTKVETLQDAIYSEAARARYSQAQEVRVHFVFPAEKPDKIFLRAKYSDDENQLLPKTLSAIKESGTSGQYLPKKHEYCLVCARLDDLTEIVTKKANADQGGDSNEQ